jgi:hypothetical protein
MVVDLNWKNLALCNPPGDHSKEIGRPIDVWSTELRGYVLIVCGKRIFLRILHLQFVSTCCSDFKVCNVSMQMAFSLKTLLAYI